MSLASVLFFVFVAHNVIAHTSKPASNSANFCPPKTTQQLPFPYFRGLYLGWVGHYNTGDEALFQIIQEQFVRSGLELSVGVSLYPFSPSANCKQVLIDVRSNGAYDFIILGGGTILTDDKYHCELSAAQAANIPVFVAGSGMNPSTSLYFGETFQYEAEDQLKWIERFGRTGSTGYGGVRGLWSMNVVQHFFPLTKLKVLGDAGMLMSSQWERPTFVPYTIRENWVAVGYGWTLTNGKTADDIYHQNMDEALDIAFAQFVSDLMIEGVHDVVLYAMDPASHEASWKLSVRVMEYMKTKHIETNVSKLYLIPQILDSYSLASLFTHSKVTVNYKLHGSILSAAVGTPFVAVAYHSKSWDFVSDLAGYPNELTIETQAIEKDPKLLLSAFSQVVEPKNFAMLKRVLKAAKEKITLRWNFEVSDFLQVLKMKNSKQMEN